MSCWFCSLTGQVEEMRKEMESLTARLKSMTETQTRVHRDNVRLRKSLKQKESEFERSLQDTVSKSAHNELRAHCDELRATLEDEQRVNEESTVEIERLKRKNGGFKQELQKAQKKIEDMQAEFREVSEKLETSSQHVHSLQQELQEQETANTSMHQTLQKFIREQQETLEENEELKRELNAREQSQNAANQTHDRLHKESTSLKCQQQEREKEVAVVSRQLQESRAAAAGLQMDKESLAEQLKCLQRDAGTYQVRLREMEETLASHKQDMMAERQSHTQKVRTNHLFFIDAYFNYPHWELSFELHIHC